MKELLSHPDKLLIDHLSEVSNIAVKNVKRKEYGFSFLFKNTDDGILIADVVYIAAAFHDIAKATSYFQDYIRNPDRTHNQLKNHALLSALFAFFVAEGYFKTLDGDEIIKQLLSVFIFTAVKRHHGNLENLSGEVFFKEWEDNLHLQVNSIEHSKIEPIIDTLLIPLKLDIEWSKFVEFIINKEYDEKFEDFSFDVLEDIKDFDPKKRLEFFYIHQLIYSNLLFADKNDVILDISIKEIERINVEGQIIEFRKSNGFDKPKTKINYIKNEAYTGALQNLERVFNKYKHNYSITLPTGLGKTITSYAIADKMRKLAGFNNSNIVINIPFTSIIDQIFEVYSEILQSYNSEILLKHHHLAEPEYKPIGENTLNYDKSSFLIETWQSDTVVTTFVQLIETLLTADKAKLMKLSHLANSIVLLDEIQTINYELWETVRESFKVLGEKFNIYFILISATQPFIFTPDEDIIEIVPDYRKYFKVFNRTKLICNNESYSFDDLKIQILNYISENDKDTLIILNTKDSARECFEYLADNLDENIKPYFLSTLITPYERKKIIERIIRKSKKQKVIVSTQLVEAGVDISVDTVFRQMAPLDSIIQAAGRANRHNEKNEISEVHVFEIKELTKVSGFIYGSDLLIKTKNVLKEFNQIEEKDYLQLIERYFQEVRKQSDQTTPKQLNAMLNLDFSEINKFELIKKERKTESVFIQLNKKAKLVWEQFEDIYNNKNLSFFEKREAFGKIKSKFYNYVINVPVPYDSDRIDFDREKKFNFYISELENPSSNYNYSENNFRHNTGYIKSGIVISL